MSESIFIFGEKRTLPDDNLIFISQKDGDYNSLETYLTEVKNMYPYDFTNNHLNIKYFSEEDVFISLFHENPLDLRLKEPLISRNCVVIIGEELDLEDIILNKFNYEDLDYDIFSGDRVYVDYKEKITSVMTDLLEILSQMLKAGYYELRNVDKVDDWIITFQDPILDIFIRYHQLETSAGDITSCDEFLINPEYRRTICIMIMKILANFLINNDLIPKRTVKKYSGWENPSLWDYIKNEIKIII